MAEEIKEENTDEVIERNLIADLKGDIISDELIESNKIYSEGYNPYYARRRMDKWDESKYEVTNEMSVLIEFGEIGCYGNRKICSKHHFTDLIEFLKKDLELNITEQANAIVRYYFSNIISYKVTKGKVLAKCIRYVGRDNMEYILKDIVAMPKVDDKIAVTLAMMLYAVEKEDFVNVFGQELLERVLTYISMAHQLFLADGVTPDMYNKYGVELTKILAAFGEGTVSMIIIPILKIEEIKKYPTKLLMESPGLFRHYYFKSIDEVNDFIELARKETPELTVAAVRHAIELSKEFRFELPVNIDLYEDDEYTYFSKKACIFHNSKKWYIYLKLMISSDEYFDILCVCMATTPVDNLSDFSFNNMVGISEYIRTNLIRLYGKIEGEDVETRKKKVSTKTNYHFKALEKLLECVKMYFFQSNAPSTSVTDILYVLITKTIFPNEMLEIFKRVPGRNRFSSEQLNTFLEVAEVARVLQCAKIDTNIHFIQKHFGTLYVELPHQIIPREDSMTSDSQLDWVWKNIDNEQRMFFPFHIPYMRRNKDKFAPYQCEANLDRYIAAYGINWVEENGPVNISDMVKANAINDISVARRYLDIILLDDELRKIFLSFGNNGFRFMAMERGLLRSVLDSKTFSDDIKSQCITVYILINRKKYEKDHDALVDFLKYANDESVWCYKLKLLVSKLIGQVVGILV